MNPILTAIVIALAGSTLAGCGGSEEVAPADQVEPQTVGDEGVDTDLADIPPEERPQPADTGEPIEQADPVGEPAPDVGPP